MEKYQREQEKQMRNPRVIGATLAFCVCIIVLLLLGFRGKNYQILLPKSTGQVSAKATLSVSIKDWSNGKGTGPYTYHINGDEKAIDFSEVEGTVIGLLQNEEDPTFSIYADESVPVSEVVQVMNIAKRNHYKVIMATSPE